MTVLLAVREILKSLHILLTSAHSQTRLHSRNIESFIDLFSTRPPVAPSQCWAASVTRHLTALLPRVCSLCVPPLSGDDLYCLLETGSRCCVMGNTVWPSWKVKFASRIFCGLFCLSRKMYGSRRRSVNFELWNYPYKRWHRSLGTH